MEKNSHWVDALLKMMADLRDKNSGCPWDQAQTFKSLVPHTIEEAYEVVDTIERGDNTALKDELGDLLFQVLFYSQMAEEEGGFSFQDVAENLIQKMTKRHPHVFGDVKFENMKAQHKAWELSKHQSKAINSVCDDIPLVLPALSFAQKLQKRAASIGFDWQSKEQVWDKCLEEQEEIAEVLAHSPLNKEALEEELGDLMFSLVNFIRHIDLDAEAVMRKANQKFEKRFRKVEAMAKSNGESMETLAIETLEAYWQAVKNKN